MTPSSLLRVGARIPAATLAELDASGGVRPVKTEALFAGVKAIVVGVPGAFTPVCTDQHLPAFIETADRLRRSGYAQIVCIVTSDPFATDAWAVQLDPQRKLRWLSDGNLDFARAAGLLTSERTLFLGERSRRYAMVLDRAVITQFSVETSVLQVTCTGADDLLL